MHVPQGYLLGESTDRGPKRRVEEEDEEEEWNNLVTGILPKAAETLQWKLPLDVQPNGHLLEGVYDKALG